MSKMIMRNVRNLDAEIINFALDVQEAGGQAWVVGGAVRDWHLGLTPKDIDIEVTNVSLRVFESLPGWSITPAGDRFGIWLVKQTASSGNTVFEVALPMTRHRFGPSHNDTRAVVDTTLTIDKSLARRDFTMNAAAVNVLTGEMIDPFGGMDDLKSGILRAVSGENFGHDPLRVLRGMQFCSRFNLVADRLTVASAADNIDRFETLSPERVRIEWQKWVSGINPAAGIRFLRQCGWTACFPVLESINGLEQDEVWHPEGDVLEHTIQALENVRTSDPIVIWATLLHDIGKADTTIFIGDNPTIDGGWDMIVSPGHASAGAEMVVDFFISAGWNIGNRVPEWMDAVISIVGEHMCVASFDNQPSDRAIRNLAARLGNANMRQWAQVCIADISGRGAQVAQDDIDTIVSIADRAGNLNILDNGPAALVMGRHLIDAGVMQPGRQMGAALRAVMQAQLDGDVNSVDDGVNWVRNWIRNQGA